ncbi:MAG: hypothetical protein IIW36_04100 [Clostridia bacterium]|nr:hypothetical protein [Clostridia bacterium]
MSKLFPSMSSKPEKIQIFATIPCWLWVFVLLPMFMPFVGLGIWDQWEISVYLEIFYHVANGLLMLVLMLGYLKEEWFMVTTDVPYYLKHILLTVGLIAGAELVLLGTLFLCDFHFADALECLPMTEMSVSHTPLFLVNLEPILGTVVLSFFVPISVCALFYCFAFAPLCYKRPWLAYVCIALITLIPSIIDILWRGEAVLAWCAYLVRLPIHLLACWSYQKTDNVWTPIVSLSITNLLLSIVLQVFLLR